MPRKQNTSNVTIKVYHGYGHKEDLILYGHVLRGKPVMRSRYTNNIVTNIVHLVKLFLVKPVKNVRVMLQWNNQQLYAVTGKDGFFKFQWASVADIAAGWHEVQVHLLDGGDEISATGTGKLFVPHSTQFAFISDIDDTIMVSYAATRFKRLQTLFTKNPHTRKLFDDVTHHYQLLSLAHTNASLPNPFFYVSSSEWNLYEDLNEFFKQHSLPKGAFLLSELKRWYQLFKTGKTKHQGKIMRIARILKTFPKQRFILLGDNGQKDPEIYAAIANMYPGKIEAIYIRNIHPFKEKYAQEKLAEISSKEIHICIFKNTSEALLYSRSIGLITSGQT